MPDRQTRLLRALVEARVLLRTRVEIGPNRTHKASSAEAILRHCLRQRGWTRLYRAGQLSGVRHLRLLHDVRLYARAWLRHEAIQFARHYLGASAERSIARALGDGLRSHFGRFFGRAKSFVRESIVAGMAALFGPAPLTGEEIEAADREATKQEQFFDRFYNEIEFWGKPSPREIPAPPPPQGIPVPAVRPPMTPSQFVSRVESYGGSVHHAAQNANRATAIKQGVFKVERLVMGRPKTDHCPECPNDAALGWQPIGTLRPIGDRECGVLCLCHFEYSDGHGGRPQIQGNRGPLPAPDGVRMEPEDNDVYMVAEPPGTTVQAPIAGPPK